MNSTARKGFACRARSHLVNPTPGGEGVSRGDKGIVQHEIERFGKHLIFVAWSEKKSWYVTVDEVDILESEQDVI